MFQSPLKWFKLANSRPADPASPIPSQGNHNKGAMFSLQPVSFLYGSHAVVCPLLWGSVSKTNCFFNGIIS